MIGYTKALAYKGKIGSREKGWSLWPIKYGQHVLQWLYKRGKRKVVVGECLQRHCKGDLAVMGKEKVSVKG